MPILGTGDKTMTKEVKFSAGTSANKRSPVAWWSMPGRRASDAGVWDRRALLNLDGGCYMVYICIRIPCYYPKAQEILNFKHGGSQSGILGAVESSNSRGRNFVGSRVHRRIVISKSGASSEAGAVSEPWRESKWFRTGQCPAQGHCDIRQPSQVWV